MAKGTSPAEITLAEAMRNKLLALELP